MIGQGALQRETKVSGTDGDIDVNAMGTVRPNDDIGQETRLELFRVQVEIRDFEKRAFDLFLQNLVKGTSHLSLGQEAVAAGFVVFIEKGYM